MSPFSGGDPLQRRKGHGPRPGCAPHKGCPYIPRSLRLAPGNRKGRGGPRFLLTRCRKSLGHRGRPRPRTLSGIRPSLTSQSPCVADRPPRNDKRSNWLIVGNHYRILLPTSLRAGARPSDVTFGRTRSRRRSLREVRAEVRSKRPRWLGPRPGCALDRKAIDGLSHRSRKSGWNGAKSRGVLSSSR